MSLLALAAAALLLFIAALHAAWGFGATWPERDAKSLARRVVGFPGIERMPRPASCFFVASALALTAILALAAAGLAPTRLPLWLAQTALAGAAVVFGLRGLATYTDAWRAKAPEEPFATADRRLYGPLCLALSLALTIIVFGGSS